MKLGALIVIMSDSPHSFFYYNACNRSYNQILETEYTPQFGSSPTSDILPKLLKW